MRAFRQPRVTDLPAIMQIQRECYPLPLREDRLTIEERLAAAGDYCWVAHDDNGIFAYLFAYPSVLGKVTPLDGSFAVDTDGGTLYLHDLAVSKRAAGHGLGSSLVEIALASAVAQGFTHSTLVAVQESSAFWKRHGYCVHDALAQAEAENLQTYPGSPVYMSRRIIGR